MKVSFLSALLMAAASTASAFVLKTNNGCGLNTGLCMSAVAEAETAVTEGTAVKNIRSVYNFSE